MYVKWLVLRHKCAFFPHFTEKIGADFVQITFKPKKHLTQSVCLG